MEAWLGRSVPRWVAFNVALAAAYFSLTLVSTALAQTALNVAPIWLAAGFVLGFCILVGPRAVVGVGLVSAFLTWRNVGPWPAFPLIPAGLVVGVAVASTLVRRHAAGPRAFLTPRNTTRFLLLVTVLAPVISVTTNVAVLHAMGRLPPGPLGEAWLSRVLGAATGTLVFTPIPLLFGHPAYQWPRRRVAETLVLTLAAAAVLASTLMPPTQGPLAEMPLPFFALPVVIWAAARFHQRGAALAAIPMALVGIAVTARRAGPFFNGDVASSVLVAQVFAGVTAATALVMACFVARGVKDRDDLRRSEESLAAVVKDQDRMLEARSRQLRESLERFQTLADTAPIGIFHTTAQGKVDYANAAWARISGRRYDAGDLPSTILPEDQPALSVKWRQALRDRTEFSAEFRFVHGDGRIVHALTHTAPVLDAEGGMTGFVGTVEDVTQRKQREAQDMEASLQAKELERLREMDAFRRQFIDNAAHELRTPMLPMRSQLYLLRAQLAEHANAPTLRSLDVVERNLERLSVLVEDILDASRLERSALPLHVGPMDLHAVVRDALESFQPTARDLQIQLTSRSVGDGAMQGDARRLSQVLFNLLNNAIKFTPAGGRIDLECRRDGDVLRVGIEDTGVGLAPGAAALLFQPFIQLHPVNGMTPGSGLGLSICKAIVERHGGTISAHSDGPGRGMRVQVVLPLEPPEPEPAPQGRQDLDLAVELGSRLSAKPSAATARPRIPESGEPGPARKASGADALLA